MPQATALMLSLGALSEDRGILDVGAQVVPASSTLATCLTQFWLFDISFEWSYQADKKQLASKALLQEIQGAADKTGIGEWDLHKVFGLLSLDDSVKPSHLSYTFPDP